MWFKNHEACQAITANQLYHMRCDKWPTSSSRHGEVGMEMFAMADVGSPQPRANLNNGHRESMCPLPCLGLP